jgi:putative sigma-54 modulation protein
LTASVLRGVEANEDMYAAIDLVYDKMVRQIHKYKTKIARRMKGGTFHDNMVQGAHRKRKKNLK